MYINGESDIFNVQAVSPTTRFVDQRNSGLKKVKSCLQPGLVVWKGMHIVYYAAQYIVAQRNMAWDP